MLPDRYELHARVVPLLLLAAPLLVVAGLYGVSPDVPIPGVTVIGALLLAAALVASDALSDAGRSLQDRRWRELGGSPTVKGLLVDDQVGAQRRKRLEELFGLVVDPADSKSAERASSALRDYARATGNVRVAEANRNYGRVRNLYAVRWPGFILATIGALLSLLPVSGWSPALHDVPSEAALGCAVVCASLAGWWLFNDFESQLRQRDDQYADRLLAALDTAAREG